MQVVYSGTSVVKGPVRSGKSQGHLLLHHRDTGRDVTRRAPCVGVTDRRGRLHTVPCSSVGGRGFLSLFQGLTMDWGRGVFCSGISVVNRNPTGVFRFTSRLGRVRSRRVCLGPDGALWNLSVSPVPGPVSHVDREASTKDVRSDSGVSTSSGGITKSVSCLYLPRVKYNVRHDL